MQLPEWSVALFGRLQSCRCFFAHLFFLHIVYADRAGRDSAQSCYLSFKETPRVRVLFGQALLWIRESDTGECGSESLQMIDPATAGHALER